MDESITTVGGKRPPQKRGVARRKRLLEAARNLLEARQLDEITLKEVAEHAGVPYTSCYHLYSSKQDFIRSLAEYLTPQVREVLFAPYPSELSEGWQDIIKLYIRRCYDFYKDRPADRQVFLGGHIPPEVRLESQTREKGDATRLKEIVAERFKLPRIRNIDIVFFRSLEFARLLFSFDEIEHGCLHEATAKEAAQAQIAYLQLYIPPNLELNESDGTSE